MNFIPWKDVNDVTTTRREGEVEEEAVVVATTTSRKTVNKKPPTLVSSSSSWMKSKDPRIVRVSRAFGGKDRHSKVCTLRGLRDRRVRLSVPTAIQLYDIQERLGVDQPSKAVEWLLDAAKEAIDELPPLPVSPESFSFFNHHQPFLNLGQDPTQLGFKINGCVEDSSTTNREENNRDGRNEEVIITNNHQVGSYGTYHNIEHHHGSFQTNHHPHQLHSLVPFPSQILVCQPTTSRTTIQSLFPSSTVSQTTNTRQMVKHFQVSLMDDNSSSSSSQNISTLYSLLHGNTSNNHEGSNIENRISPAVQFNRANISRLVGSERSENSDRDPHM